MKRKIYSILIPVSVLLLFLMLQNCTKDNEFDITIIPCDTININYQKVQPVLQDNCYACHAVSQPPSNVRLDSYDEVIKVASSGKLWGAINWLDGFTPMPYNKSKLSDCEINIIKSWIENGLQP